MTNLTRYGLTAGVVFFVLAVISSPCPAQDQSQVKTLISQLGSAQDRERIEAEGNLSRLPPTSVAGPLAEALSDPNWKVRVGATRLLARTRDKTVSPAVARLLKDDIWEVRKQAAETLGALEDPSSDKALKAAADDENSDVRAAVLAARLRVAPDADLLKKCLTGNDKAIRKAAANALYKAPMDESLTAVVKDLLRDEDIDIARNAARFLSETGDTSCADALAAALTRSADRSFRRSIVEGLVKLKGRSAARVLIGELQGNDPASRSDLLSALRRLYVPEAAETVLPILTDRDSRLRMQACMFLGDCGEPKAVEALCQIVVSDPNIDVRRTAAYALGRIGDPNAVETLAGLLTATNYTESGVTLQRYSPLKDTFELHKTEALEQAVLALGVIGGSKAADALVEATKHPDERVRTQAMLSLAETGDPRALDLVIEGLSSTNYFAGFRAAQASAFCKDRRLVAPLIALVRGGRSGQITMMANVRGGGGASGGYYLEAAIGWTAADVLHEKWPQEAKPVLLEEAKNVDKTISWTAAQLLADDGDRDVIPALRELLKNAKSEYTRSSAGAALCKFKDQEAFALCLGLAQNRFLGEALPKAMGESAEGDSLKLLGKELKAPEGRRLAALRVVGYTGRPEMASLVLPFIESSDAVIRQAAIASLGRLKNPAAVGPLTKMLTDPGDAYETTMLAEALGRIGDPTAVASLRTAFQKHKRDSQRAPQIAVALARLGDKPAMAYLRLRAESSGADLELAKALYEIDPSAGVDALVTVVHCLHGAIQYRRDAVEMLGQVGNAQAIESLRFALRDESLEVRQAARKARAKLKVPATAPAPAADSGR
jgi:HEAT repeat protein